MSSFPATWKALRQHLTKLKVTSFAHSTTLELQKYHHKVRYLYSLKCVFLSIPIGNTWDSRKEHSHTDPCRPAAIPRRSWMFCVTHPIPYTILFYVSNIVRKTDRISQFVGYLLELQKYKRVTDKNKHGLLPGTPLNPWSSPALVERICTAAMGAQDE